MGADERGHERERMRGKRKRGEEEDICEGEVVTTPMRWQVGSVLV